MEKSFLQIEAEIFKVLKTIYDPEIPVNIYDLGLIYEVEVDDYDNVDIKMTLTAPNCPVADDLVKEVQDKSAAVPGVQKVTVDLVFEPAWEQSMMSEEAQLEMGML